MVSSSAFTVHVANLYEEPFAAVLAGRKVFEYRERQRPDPVIEALTSGTLIVFRECGSARALLSRCVAPPVRRPLADGRLEYAIPITGRKPVVVTPPRKWQGWRVMQAVWVREPRELRLLA
jgi:hypothetical protein